MKASDLKVGDTFVCYDKKGSLKGPGLQALFIGTSHIRTCFLAIASASSFLNGPDVPVGTSVHKWNG